MSKNIAVIWDIQNVLPSQSNAGIFVDGLLSYCDSIGNKSYMMAVGDWKQTIAENIPSILSENGFELLYIPQIESNGKKTKDSVDFVLITKATEMVFQYPHIDTYVILTGDVDFRPLVQLLKKHGKTVNIIYNPDNVAERLLESADDHKDYRELIPDETDQIDLEDELSIENKELEKDEIFQLLTEAISQMESNEKVPTPGSVKVTMKMINDSFTGKEPGISKNWMNFISEAGSKGYISYVQKNKDLVLSVKKKTKSKNGKDVFALLVEMMKTLSSNNDWLSFTKINQKMIEKNIRIKDFNYSKFKKLALEAEKRGLVETKNEGMRWSARIK